MAVSLTRGVTFRAIHRYRVPGWSEEENRRRFGATADSHSHAYRCAVTVTGPRDPVTGMIIDLPELDRLLAEEVMPFEDTSLHEVLPATAGLPTCETLATHLFDRLSRRLPAGIRLERVRVAEDDTLHADCTGLA